MALAEDDEPVQGLVANGLDDPPTMRVGSRPAIGREDDPDAIAAQDLIEFVSELTRRSQDSRRELPEDSCPSGKQTFGRVWR